MGVVESDVAQAAKAARDVIERDDADDEGVTFKLRDHAVRTRDENDIGDAATAAAVDGEVAQLRERH